MAIFKQALSTVILSYVCTILGIMFAWPSSTLTLFASENTTLHRPMTSSEMSLFGSLTSMGGLVSTPLAGFLLDRLGRKNCSILSASMNLIAWGMISVSNRVEVVLSAVFIAGLSSAAFQVFTAFITEFCQENIRGTMTSGILTFYTLGALISFILGGQLSYHAMVYTCFGFSVLSVMGLFILKESPLYLISKGFDQEAAKSIAFYRSAKVDSKIVQTEMENIRRTLNADIDDSDGSPEEKEKLREDQKPLEARSFLGTFKKSRSTKLAFAICLTLVTASIFQGQSVLVVYAEPIFTKAIPSMSPNVCGLMVALINMIVGFIAAFMTDALGRRPLVIYGSIASGICCVLLASQIQTEWGPGWLTAVVMFLFSLVYNIGGGNVPYVIIGEVFLPEVKSLITMIIFEWAWLCYFFILLIFQPAVTALGLGPVFYIFAGVCFGTAIFCVFFLPETRGLPVDTIQLLFSPKRRKASVKA